MDILTIIKENLPEGVEVSDKTLKAIEKEIKQQQGLEFVPKSQYAKKVEIIDDMTAEMEDLLGKSADGDNYREKFEKLDGEFKKYKDDTAAEYKKNAVKLEWLNDPEYSPHDMDYILDKTDLTKIELDASGKPISGFKEQRDGLIKDRSGLFKPKTEQGKQSKPNSKPLGNEPPDGVKPTPDNEPSFGADLAKKKAAKLPTKTVAQIDPWAAGVV